MLIVNADDFGKDEATSDNIIASFKRGAITSTSAMMFMQDSERAAELGRTLGIDVGLHLNLDEEFSGTIPQGLLRQYHGTTADFLNRSKYHQIIYNPRLRTQFEYSFKVQCEEFLRLYGRTPSHINGHHHRHLCANVLLGKIIPRGARIRRSFTFRGNEKGFLNRSYRRIVDAVVVQRYVSTDMFFSVAVDEPIERLREKVSFAFEHNVEIMVHVSTESALRYLLNGPFINAIAVVQRGVYGDL